jgi:ribose transport system substrate-binding protein
VTKTLLAPVGLLAAILGSVLLISGCGRQDNSSQTSSTSSTQPSAAAPLTIAVIPKGTTHTYWQSVQAGAEKAGQEFGATIIYKGPLLESDVAGQQNLVEDFVGQGVSGIVLAPIDDAALLSPVQASTAKGIPVVVIDSALKGVNGTDYVAFVSTNNRVGGQMAGDEMTKLLGGKGKLVMLRYTEYSASTNDREAGFLDSIQKSPGFTMLVSNQYGGATEATAQEKAEDLLDQLQQADGIYCPNESTTLGMLHVLEQHNLAGKVKFVGFDATPREVDGMKSNEIDSLVAQDPVKMGYLGVKACIDHIQGKPVDAVIDSGVKLITHDNLNDPDIQKFLAGG